MVFIFQWQSSILWIVKKLYFKNINYESNNESYLFAVLSRKENVRAHKENPFVYWGRKLVEDAENHMDVHNSQSFEIDSSKIQVFLF